MRACACAGSGRRGFGRRERGCSRAKPLVTKHNPGGTTRPRIGTVKSRWGRIAGGIHARGLGLASRGLSVWAPRLVCSFLRACSSPRTVTDFERSIGNQSGKERRPGVGEQGRVDEKLPSFQANNDKRDEDDAFYSSLRDLARHNTVATKELLAELQVGSAEEAAALFGCTAHGETLVIAPAHDKLSSEEEMLALFGDSLEETQDLNKLSSGHTSRTAAQRAHERQGHGKKSRGRARRPRTK